MHAGNIFLWDKLVKAAPGLPVSYLGEFMRAAPPAPARKPRLDTAPAPAAPSRSRRRRGGRRGRTGAKRRGGHAGCILTYIHLSLCP